MTKKPEGIMLDIETMGLDFDAKIIQIGMVSFDEDYKPIDTFLVNVDPEAQPKRTTTKSTLKFWSEQPKHVVRSVLKDPLPPEDAAEQVMTWIADRGYKTPIWANHVLFDINILESFCVEFGDGRIIDNITAFYVIADYATLFGVVAKEVGGRTALKEIALESYLEALGDEDFLPHNALDDCLLQLHTLSVIMEGLTGGD